MPTTPRLGLDYIGVGELQAYITFNELVVRLDALVQTSVLSASLAAPPGSPSEGDLYLVAASPTGVWTGHAQAIAQFIQGGWLFYAPTEGWTAYDRAVDALKVYNGTSWVAV